MSEILQFALPVQSNVDSLWIDRRSVPTPHRERSVPSLCRDSRSVPSLEAEDRAGIEVGNGKVTLVDSSGLRHVQTSSPPL